MPWCAGEDAIFVCPCGPNGNFYGHRPTCWRDWPTSAAAWRDMSCGPTVAIEASESNPFRAPQPTPAQLPTPTELPTPEPAPFSSPFGLPPIPEAPAPAEDNAKTEDLGPPVLPPSSSTGLPKPSQAAKSRLSSSLMASSPTPSSEAAQKAQENSAPSTAIAKATSQTSVGVEPERVVAKTSATPDFVGKESLASYKPSAESPLPEAEAANAVFSTVYVEGENSLSVMTAAGPELGSVEPTEHASESTSPPAPHSPKFIRPAMGYGFVR